MPYIDRFLDANKALAKKSLFLFGPRQTGKSSLIRETIQADYSFNLLATDLYLQFTRAPWQLREIVTKTESLLVIDEIQRVPDLLNEVHLLIEERGVRALLTGSSARKLRRGGINLLGGRARSRTLHPFVSHELTGDFDLMRACRYGGLPSIWFSEEPGADLRAYVNEYLREEIAAEGLVRNVPAFSRFLEVASLCSGKMLNFTEIANDAQVPRTTIHEYFQILKDTLIGFELPALSVAKTRKPLATSRMYFFDTGVVRALQGRTDSPLRVKTEEFGTSLEHWIFHELRAWLDYRGESDGLHYWRTTSGFEVDFVLHNNTAIEVKAKSSISPRDLKGIRAISQDVSLKNRLVVCLEKHARRVDPNIEILPVETFLQRLWQGAYAA